MEAFSRATVRLRPAVKTPWATIRRQTRGYRIDDGIELPEQVPPITPVATQNLTDYGSIGRQKFRELAFGPEKPLLMKAGPMFLQSDKAMPALGKWFDFKPSILPGDNLVLKRPTGKFMSEYLRSFASTTILPFELAYPQTYRLHGETIHRFIESLREESDLEYTTDRMPENLNHDRFAHLAAPSVLADLLQSQLPSSRELENKGRILGRPKNYPLEKILHFTAPLALLDAAMQYNLKRSDIGVRKLYVAQASLNDLPKQLKDDLPVPSIVKLAGKGDIYDSSIWLGLEPTYTPLHRDPNPNLFIQLCGNKIVRLLPPASGDQLFRNVQFRLGNSLHANSRLRGPEMMDGPERDLVYKAVWYENGLQDAKAPQGPEDQGNSTARMQEARLLPGDSLFIPKGWWHSVTSEEDAGRLNASVNWWFR